MNPNMQFLIERKKFYVFSGYETMEDIKFLKDRRKSITVNFDKLQEFILKRRDEIEKLGEIPRYAIMYDGIAEMLMDEKTEKYFKHPMLKSVYKGFPDDGKYYVYSLEIISVPYENLQKIKNLGIGKNDPQYENTYCVVL